MWWGWGGDRLCQTRPIPRSPDGDKKSNIRFQISRVKVSCVIGNMVRGVCNWIRKPVTPSSVTTRSSQPTSRVGVAPRKHFIMCRQFTDLFVQLKILSFVCFVCMFIVHVLCEVIISYIHKKQLWCCLWELKLLRVTWRLMLCLVRAQANHEFHLFATLIYYY